MVKSDFKNSDVNRISRAHILAALQACGKVKGLHDEACTTPMVG